MADDMGFSDLGCYGGEVHTPTLDKLANEGVKMRQFYNNARCCPTRASLLTGRYPHSVGIGHMVTLPTASFTPGAYQGFLDRNTPTIANVLRDAGYRTYMTGKWHVGERPEDWPVKRGFDRYFGLISGASSFYEITPQEKAKRVYAYNDRSVELPASGFYATDAFTDTALSFLKEHRQTHASDPFFLYLAYTAPHFPLHAPEEDVARYTEVYKQGWEVIRQQRYVRQQEIGLADNRYQMTPKTMGLPVWDGDAGKDQWVRKMAVYAAMIDRMDQNIGRLVAHLEATGTLKNTVIFFLSDNGACAEKVNVEKLHNPVTKIGERGSYASTGENWANVSNTPFKLYKHNMHEGGISSPLIAYWPAGIKPRKGFIEGPGHVMDLLPTALDLAGAAPAAVDGQSLSFLWTGRKPASRSLFWEHESNKAFREGRWKLVKEQDEAAWQLYDMANDPTEMRDLSKEQPVRLKEMKARYEAWATRVGIREFKGKPYGKQ
jgi:arylsulfatase